MNLNNWTNVLQQHPTYGAISAAAYQPSVSNQFYAESLP